jgi:hypothetical protein
MPLISALTTELRADRGGERAIIIIFSDLVAGRKGTKASIGTRIEGRGYEEVRQLNAVAGARTQAI